MQKRFAVLILVLLLPAFVGCSSDSAPPPLFVADILSDQASDGDIAYYPATDDYFITHGPDVLFFGIDDFEQPNPPEYRAFLDFPLDGSTGYDVVPARARIVSATLEVFIDTVEFAARVPVLIELVSYPVGELRPFDFDSPPLSDHPVALDFFPADIGQFVAIDVTPLMQEAQRFGLLDFQLRFVLDFTTATGFVGIEDLPTVALTAPLLSVVYRYQ